MVSKRTLRTESQILLRSVVKGDKSRVEELLQQSEWSPEDLGEILWVALPLGTVEAAHMLVEAGADVNMADPFNRHGYTFLHHLVMSVNPRCHDLALLMLQHGANANVSNDALGNVLECAIRYEIMPIEAIEKLVQLGARVTTLPWESANSRRIGFYHPPATTILPWVIEGCSKRAANALRLCVDEWLSWPRSCPPMDRQWLILVAAILDMRFPVGELERHGFALQLAVQTGQVELVRSLVDYGFSVNGPVGSDIFPLYEAVRLEHSAITELLLRAGAEVNEALHEACDRGSVENIEVLLRHGADVNRIDSWGVTAFWRIKSTIIMSVAHRIFIRHLAALVSKDKYVNNYDLSFIENRPEMRTWYTRCRDELQLMRNCKVIRDTSIFCFFREGDLRELLFATRNYKFAENVSSEYLKDQFPIYGEELALSLEKAKKQKRWITDGVETLSDSVEQAFNIILPVVPMDMIARYLYMEDIVY